MKKNKLEENVEKKEYSGEKLLQEYFDQDKNDKHHMGYSIYTRTESSGGCCCC